LLQRKSESIPRLTRVEKVFLAVLGMRFKASVQGARVRLEQSLLLFRPETIFKWHREVMARKWTFAHTPKVSRPRTAAELEALLMHLAKENPSWGTDRRHGELLKLGIKLGATTIRAILRRRGIPPAPERVRQGSSWSTLLRHYKDQLLACDFFTVETA
jgi:transposase